VRGSEQEWGERGSEQEWGEREGVNRSGEREREVEWELLGNP
jgi:hypothetical protein